MRWTLEPSATFQPRFCGWLVITLGRTSLLALCFATMPLLSAVCESQHLFSQSLKYFLETTVTAITEYLQYGMCDGTTFRTSVFKRYTNKLFLTKWGLSGGSLRPQNYKPFDKRTSSSAPSTEGLLYIAQLSDTALRNVRVWHNISTHIVLDSLLMDTNFYLCYKTHNIHGLSVQR